MSDDTKVTKLFDVNRKPEAPKAEPKSAAKDWRIVLTNDEVFDVNGHLVLNGMMVAILDDPDDSFSLKFYASGEDVRYVTINSAPF